jgi:peroxidase
MLAGENTERASIRNSRLHGFEAIDAIKAAVEKACRGKVSCADILAYASRDAVIVTGGTSWKVMGGRRDGRISNKVEPEQNIPDATAQFGELVGTFAEQGLSPQQMVDLSGTLHSSLLSYISLPSRN